jgi:hypothetical protein
MTLPRVLEPEVMDTEQEAVDYDAMDHRAVNTLFVSDLLAAVDATRQLTSSTGTGTAQIPVELCRRLECRVMAIDGAHMLELALQHRSGRSDRAIQLVKADAKRWFSR